MGTYFSFMTRRELIADIARGCRAVRHCIQGSLMWAVGPDHHEADPADPARRLIHCFHLKGGGGENGYKPCDETWGPYEYGCPLAYLALAPRVRNNAARWWRARVRRHHAGRARPAVGQSLRLRDGCTPARVEIVSLRPLVGEDEVGSRYRVRRRHLRPTVPFADELPRDWLTPAVRGLAEGILADKGWDRTPILADALEEAGADHPALLAELRAVNECNWGLLTVAEAAGIDPTD